MEIGAACSRDHGARFCPNFPITRYIAQARLPLYDCWQISIRAVKRRDDTVTCIRWETPERPLLYIVKYLRYPHLNGMPVVARATKNRDQHCQYPGCIQTRHLQLHHVQHWADGGSTCIENGVSLRISSRYRA